MEMYDVTDIQLRVMTFNLLTSTKNNRRHPWRLRKRNIARIFENLQPDVVGTQEANYSQLLELSALLPDYEFVGEGNLGRQQALNDNNWYCAIFYRRDRIRLVEPETSGDNLWLSPTPEVPASQFHLGTRPRLVSWHSFQMIGSGRPFVFGTTHLEAVNSWHRKRSTRMLREYVNKKVQEMGSDIPIFLTGDFNAVAQSPEIQAMSSADQNLEPMFDAWAEVRGDQETDGATFRGLGLRDQLGHKLLGPRRIDYVFFRPRVMVESVQRVDFTGLDHRSCALPSDHFPVLAQFSLAG